MKPTAITKFLVSVLVMISGTWVNVYAQTDVSNVVKAPNLIIYRPNQNFEIQHAYFRVFVNGKQLGKLSNHSHYLVNLEAGVHTISANDGSKNKIEVTIAEEGKIFISAIVKRRPSYHLAFTNSSSKQFRSEAPKLYAQFLKRQSVSERNSVAAHKKENRL